MNESELSKNMVKTQSCRMATREKFGLTLQPSLEMSENSYLTAVKFN
jgi:hypothetical protein